MDDMFRNKRSRSIAFKLAIAFIVLAVFQSVLLALALTAGGVSEQIQTNQYRIFSEKVLGRKDNLSNEMNHIWTNFANEMDQIRQYFAEGEYTGQEREPDQILEDIAPILKDALNHTETTGAFFILPGEDETALETVYFRNTNPGRTYKESSNIYLLIGPWNVAEKMQMATMANWSFRLSLDEENRAFYDKPYQAAQEEDNAEWLGYWSPPFHVNSMDEEVITYSLPLFSNDGKLLGIMGVDITLNYLYQNLPASELQNEDSYGYIIGIRSEDGEMRQVITHGSVQHRMIKNKGSFRLELENEENSVYKVKGLDTDWDIYACVKKLGMYDYNTPFAGEEWYLVGLMDGAHLLSLPQKIAKILNCGILASLCFGTVLALIISRWFTKHAKLIELAGLPVGAFEIRAHSKKVLMTSQIPMLLNLTKEQERQMYRDKQKFLEFLESLPPSSAEEHGIYCVHRAGEKRWLRITKKNGAGFLRGVVEDVTDEIIHTKALQVERDRDGLTGVKNRMAFQTAMERLNGQRPFDGQVIFIMCDLNDLKGVNDRLGHEKGDEYIRTGAECLQTAFPDGQLFRIGGDEFAVILKGISESEVNRGIDRIDKMMAEYSLDNCFVAEIAIGFAVYDPEKDVRLEGTMSRADTRMYQKKRRMKA